MDRAALAMVLPFTALHEPEHLPDQARAYRWTGEGAHIAPPNPGGSVVVRLRLGGGPDRTVPLRLRTERISIGFTVAPVPRSYAVLLPPAPHERLTLYLDSPTIRQEGRSLGVMLSGVRIAGGGGMPAAVGGALLVAAAGRYLLLRQARLWPAGAAGPSWVGCMLLVLLVCGVLLAWQVGGGWQYGLLVRGLALVTLASVGAVVLERAMGRPLLWGRQDARAPRVPAHWAIRPALSGGWAWVLAVVVLAVVVRVPWLTAPDPVGDLELAARRMGLLFHDGLGGAYRADGDYMPLRLYLLYGLSFAVDAFGGGFHAPLPPHTLVFIKLPGLLADLVTIALVFTWGRRWWSPRRAAALAALYACSPPVWINVAWWGQVDALLMLPLVAMVVVMERGGGRWSWLCWTVALLIKPQAIVLAPLLYGATLRLYGSRGVASGMGLSAALFAVACVPLVLAGQGAGLAQAYLGSVGRFPKLTIGAYNLWHLLSAGRSGDDARLLFALVSYRLVGVVLVGTVAVVVLVAVLRARREVWAAGAAVLALAFFVLPTQIHERYLFLSLAFVALCIAQNERMVWPYLLLVCSATLNIVGTLDGFLPQVQSHIARSPLPTVCALVNVGVLLFFLGYLLWYNRGYTQPAQRPDHQETGEKR